MKKKTTKKKAVGKKVSYHNRPSGMSLEEWQIALRRQAAEMGSFAISEVDKYKAPGSYKVISPVSRNEYKVVYRGPASEWNYCSCMDFKTNRLGTCKHIEAVRCWIEKHHRKVATTAPPYSSVYLSYRNERKVCLRIGTDHKEEFRHLALPYFGSDGVMLPQAIDSIMDFLHKAVQLDGTFRCYPDALNFIIDARDARKREALLDSAISDKVLDSLLKTQLYPYQKEGIRFAFRAGKSIIADEMGLGKTVQAIGTAELMRKYYNISSALIICPTSLKYQWKKEIERFTDAGAVVVEGHILGRKKLYKAPEFYKIVSYNTVCNDIKYMKTLQTDFLIMDEVQRLKNWNTQISRAARRIESDYAVILSGTPLENKLEELYSVIQFVDQYCLGPYYKFMDQSVVRSDTGKVVSYKNLNKIGEQLRNVLIRRRKQDVSLQLPGRMDKVLFVPMTEQQRSVHDEFQSSVAQLVSKWTRMRFLSEKDRRRLLLMLSQMRMVCDSTYILDQKTRHDTKVEEVMNILKSVVESGDEKVVVFSQWERMTRLVAAELDILGIRYEYLHGGVPSKARKNLVENFTDLPESRVFISTDAGSTGLNLQAASMLINLDLPWNPAVLEQRIARIYRIGQKRNIQVINMVASQTIEERMLSTLNFKTSLFEGILDNGNDEIFLENSKFDKIMEDVRRMTDEQEATESDLSGSKIKSGDSEEKANGDIMENDNEASPFECSLFANDEIDTERESNETEVGTTADMSGSGAAGNEVGTDGEEPAQLLQQGISFFKGLAQALESPESTRRLVEAIVKEDPDTGQSRLVVPVPDKKSVEGILNLFGKLLSGNH